MHTENRDKESFIEADILRLELFDRVSDIKLNKNETCSAAAVEMCMG